MSSLPSRAARWVARSIPRKPRPAILMYHRIAAETFDPWGVAVSPAHFADHLQWLKRHRTPLSLVEFAARLGSGSLPGDAIALTFDDGYACNALTAAPMLNQYGIPATMFLPVELITRGDRFWWDELKPLVLDCPLDTVLLAGEAMDLGERQSDDRYWRNDRRRRTARQRAFYDLWSRLRLMSEGPRNSIMAELRSFPREQVAATEVAPRLMTPHEARAIRSSMIEVGSHGMTHARLPALTSAAKAREIGDSVLACETITGEKPKTFAYSYGEMDEESEKLVEQCGFACACAAGHQLVGAGAELFALPRIHVWNRNSRWLRRTLASPAP
jgi:peptidoglycan/xylan/chitin deacetylase (PgdA/CDA1 family)